MRRRVTLAAETPTVPPTTPASPTTSSGQQNSRHPIIFPQLLNCSYVSKLGEGSYGKVYLVEDRRSGNIRRAVKTYDFRRVRQDYMRKFIPREIDILLKISHPNIVATHRMCRCGFFFYILMDYAAYKDLEHYIRNVCTGIIQESQARIWIRQMACALEYLHETGLAHRDVKCENILITARLNAKLADFGFSRFLNSPRGLSETYCGTHQYAAPEVLKNVPYNAQLSDVWSLGVVLFRVLNKAFPFGDGNTRKKEVIRRQESKEIGFVRQFDVSFEARQLIARMLEPLPRLRVRAQDVQNHAWLIGRSKESQGHSIRNSTRTPEENEALGIGKLRGRQFSARLPIVDQLVAPNLTEDVCREFEGRTFPDTGEIVSEDSVMGRVCAAPTTGSGV